MVPEFSIQYGEVDFQKAHEKAVTNRSVLSDIQAALLAGRITLIFVPALFDSTSNEPLSCRTLSLIP